MFPGAWSQGPTLSTLAGELVLTSPSPPSSACSNNPVICVYYRRVADGLDKSSLLQTCSGALSVGDRTSSPDEKLGPVKFN